MTLMQNKKISSSSCKKYTLMHIFYQLLKGKTQIWGSAQAPQRSREYINFKRELRASSLIHLRTASRPLFEELGWRTVFERIEYNKAILSYNSVHYMSPSYISDLFDFQSSELYSLRSVDNNDRIIPKHKTELFKKSV